MTRAWFALCFLLSLAALPPAALAWEPFRSQSRDVERGNEHLKKGQAAEALEAYETAQRKLPSEPGVQLDRGLALMAQGKLGPAREAFRNAAQGNAPADVRGEALYDLGLAFMKEADTQAKGEDLEGAQKSLQEAVDALKSSLRAKPKNRDAAWNLELARRRLVEAQKKQEEKKKQDEQKKQDEEKKDEQKQDQDQDGGTPPENQDQNKPDENKQDQDSKDPQKPDQEKPEGEGKDQKSPQPEGDKGKEQPKDGQGEQKPQPKPDKDAKEGKAKPQPAEATPEQRLPEHMKKALDALSAGEENLEKHRAQQRAQQRPRRIEKDW
jgi:Ca-activated chloride channel family protein